MERLVLLLSLEELLPFNNALSINDVEPSSSLWEFCCIPSWLRSMKNIEKNEKNYTGILQNILKKVVSDYSGSPLRDEDDSEEDDSVKTLPITVVGISGHDHSTSGDGEVSIQSH